MKHLILSVLLCALCSISISSCGTAKDKPSGEPPVSSEIPFTRIGKGALFGGGQEGFDEVNTTLHVIRTQEEWEALKRQLNAVNTVTGAFKDQELDFESEMIIACIDRVRGSGGHEISIESILEGDNSLEIKVLHKAPGDMAASVLTQPFHIVRLPKSGKSLTLNMREE